MKASAGKINHVSDFIKELSASGRYHFTIHEACKATGASAYAIRMALHRLSMRGEIASPARGFYMIVPPEYRAAGALPAAQFIPQLAEHFGIRYYAGLLSAAEYHGAAHQRPQVFQVIVGKSRRPIECGAVRVAFIRRKKMDLVQTMNYNTPRGYVRVSTPEATAFDCVGYAGRCGGLDNVAAILAELVESMKAEKMAAAASPCPSAWAQRLGYLLELVGAEGHKKALVSYVAERAKVDVPLDPSLPRAPASYSRTWKLLINRTVALEP